MTMTEITVMPTMTKMMLLRTFWMPSSPRFSISSRSCLRETPYRLWGGGPAILAPESTWNKRKIILILLTQYDQVISKERRWRIKRRLLELPEEQCGPLCIVLYSRDLAPSTTSNSGQKRSITTRHRLCFKARLQLKSTLLNLIPDELLPGTLHLARLDWTLNVHVSRDFSYIWSLVVVCFVIQAQRWVV